MQAETLAGLMGLAGAVVGAGVSTGAVIWQQRKATHAAERAYRLGLAESAANEIIRLSFEVEDLLEVRDPTEEGWSAELQQKCRGVEEQSLRFSDEDVRTFMAPVNAELFVLYNRRGVPSPSDASPLLIDIRHAMGFVLRREPLPQRYLRAHLERRRRPRADPS
ncbi:hypothetical protein OHB56_33570 [Streptomyces sp. NBC_01635]|uniref:hypothetical protein n=1 Tax=Streptomyces sp. NBC_01635 TaxID=2975904 RepID=UPI00386BC256|nr:hypothetical protein OHB56_33570 [Streptomyces sp. NBC_01635]